MEDVPSKWTVVPVGRLFRRVKRIGHAGKELLSVYRDHGVVPTSSRDDNHNNPSEDLSPYQLVKVDDLVLNKMKAWQGSIAVSEHEGIVSPAYFVYSPLPRLFELAHPRYVHYLLRNPAYISQYLRRSKGIRVGQWDLDPEEFQLVELLLPSKLEQTQIAKFLDHETAKIDRLIEKQEELIRLLKEKRQAVISHAVTKGLNPHAPLKDSGIEWLGQVPAHWTPLQFKFVIRKIDQGKSPECEARLAAPDEWGVLKSGCVNRGVFLEEEHKALPQNVAPAPAAEVKEGDLLMSRASGSTDLIGSVGLVGKVRPRLMMSDKIFRLEPESTVLPKFIWRLAASTPVRKQIELSINGAEGLANNITKESIGRLLITRPPVEEQQGIVNHLEIRCAQHDRLISSSEEQITLLQERRTALISAAVTGKIDVRHWQSLDSSENN